MKKIFLLICLFYSAVSYGQTPTPVKNVSARQMLGNDSFEKELSFLDMKIFHDRKMMQSIVRGLYENEMDPKNVTDRDLNFSQTIFSEQDSNILEKAKESKLARYNFAEGDIDILLQASYEQPFTTFKSLIMNAQIPLASYDEVSEINKVDKSAIPNFIETISESGPAIGSGPVSVSYEYEAQNSN